MNAEVIDVKAPIECQAGMKILVIGHTCWGKATTLKQAKANAKKNAPSWLKKPRFYAYIVPESAYVNGMGSIVTKRDEDPVLLIGEV